MNKSIIVLCKNHECSHNNKGDCKLDHISLADDGSLIISKLICEDAEPKEDDTLIPSGRSRI
jgi:hypothetical protein